MSTEITLDPSGDLSIGWAHQNPASPTTHYDKLYELDPPLDHDSDYIWSEAATAQDLLSLNPASGWDDIPADSAIDYIIVKCRAAKTVATGTLVIKESIKVDGTTYQGTQHTLTTSIQDFSSTWTTNPASGVAWTLADIMGTSDYPLQGFGVYATASASSYAKCTVCIIVAGYSLPIGGSASCGGAGSISSATGGSWAN